MLQQHKIGHSCCKNYMLYNKEFHVIFEGRIERNFLIKNLQM